MLLLPELELTPGVAPLDVVHQVPLLGVSGVTVNALELFDAIVCLPVCLHHSNSGEQLATNVAGKVPMPIVDNINVILKSIIGLVRVTTFLTVMLPQAVVGNVNMLLEIIIRPKCITTNVTETVSWFELLSS